MSTDKLIEGLGERLGRRSFLGKLALGTVGGALALMGFPQQVGATVPTYCCNLCQGSSYPCISRGDGCVWCWTCGYGGLTYRCCERYAYCGASCSEVLCSWAECVGAGCPSMPAS